MFVMQTSSFLKKQGEQAWLFKTSENIVKRHLSGLNIVVFLIFAVQIKWQGNIVPTLYGVLLLVKSRRKFHNHEGFAQTIEWSA